MFFDLIRVALGTRDALSRELSVVEWKQLMGQAQRQGVSSILISALERLPDNELPPNQLLMQWIGINQMTVGTYSLHCRRAKELTTFFHKAGYHCCLLKGVGLAQLYPHPERRQCGDIDLWVNGDRTAILKFLRARYPLDHIFWHHADAKFFSDVETEIHYHAGWMYNPFCNHQLQKWFDSEINAQMVVSEELGFAYPTVRFNAVYALVHLYHHLIEEGIGVRHLIDYFYIVKALPIADRRIVLELLKSFGLYRLAASVMWVLKDVCGMSSEYLFIEQNVEEGQFLLDEIMRGGNFGRYRKDNRRRNSFARWWALLPHYPREVLWVVPWKIWHKWWRLVNGRS